MRVILATRNPSKAEQIRAVFSSSAIEIVTLGQTDIAGAAVEDGNTLEENALKKVLYVREHLKDPMWVMADDTGFFVDALDGEPGVQAAYWGGEALTDEERMRYALRRMEGIPNRDIAFRTCVALASPEGAEKFFYGELKGQMLSEPRGIVPVGMPYSPIFVPESESRTLAEITLQEFNAITHRGKAFRLVRAFLESIE